ncbi:hypothetical protein [Sulfolobus acidocaldarius]|nr:hypothetical protein [Sulfolobus acidocaldarius]WCM35280.1 hypothetical protein GO597_08070 [Sulfolobus acidocaldarius DSM 639]
MNDIVVVICLDVYSLFANNVTGLVPLFTITITAGYTSYSYQLYTLP